MVPVIDLVFVFDPDTSEAFEVRSGGTGWVREIMADGY
jgi:hypothetical protein